MSDTGKHDRNEPPETALEEVLREIEDAENRPRDSDERRRHGGEAGEGR